MPRRPKKPAMKALHAEEIRPINAAGEYTTEPSRQIDYVHRHGILHKGIWLHVLTSDHHVLLHRRAPGMATCPGGLSLVGEHAWLDETDEHCVRRAVREELPAFPSTAILSLHPLRASPRWFLYDYPDGLRRDRSLISEWLLRLQVNASEARAVLEGPRSSGGGAEVEATEMRFVPVAGYAASLIEAPHTWCAPGLLPASLLDSAADICQLLRGLGPLPAGCGNLLARRRRASYPSALFEDFDASHIVADPALDCIHRRRPTPHAAKRLVVRRINCSGTLIDAEPSASAGRSPLGENVTASIVILALAIFGFRRLNQFIKRILV